MTAHRSAVEDAVNGDAHAVLVIQRGTIDGSIATCAVTIGEMPGPDDCIARNNEKLAGLPVLV